MRRSTVVIELAGDTLSRDLAAGGVFVPGCTLRMAEECNLVVCGANRRVSLPARVVYVDQHRGAGLELIGFSTAMRAQIAELAPAPGGPAGSAPALDPAPVGDDDLAVPISIDADDDRHTARVPTRSDVAPQASFESEAAGDDSGFPAWLDDVPSDDLAVPISTDAYEDHHSMPAVPRSTRSDLAAVPGEGDSPRPARGDLHASDPAMGSTAAAGAFFDIVRPATHDAGAVPTGDADAPDQAPDAVRPPDGSDAAEAGDARRAGGEPPCSPDARATADERRAQPGRTPREFQAQTVESSPAYPDATESEGAPFPTGGDETGERGVDDGIDNEAGDAAGDAAADDGETTGTGSRGHRHLRERLRGLTLAAQLKLATSGELHERIVLERLYGKNVWETLLRNPRLTAPEVSRIARYGALPRVLLEVILGNNAWLQAPEVRRALLANPRLGTDQILKVLRLVPKHELRLAAIQTAYPYAVRNVAKMLMHGE